MSYHKDEECNQSIIHLLDALCMWERETGRRSLLLVIPYNLDEKILIAEDGKPIPETPATYPERMLKFALEQRVLQFIKNEKEKL